MPTPKPNRGNRDLMRYAGLGAQIFVSLGLAVWAGYWLDGRLGLRFPLLVWLLPLLVLGGLIFGLLRDTSQKKGQDKS